MYMYKLITHTYTYTCIQIREMPPVGSVYIIGITICMISCF